MVWKLLVDTHALVAILALICEVLWLVAFQAETWYCHALTRGSTDVQGQILYTYFQAMAIRAAPQLLTMQCFNCVPHVINDHSRMAQEDIGK